MPLWGRKLYQPRGNEKIKKSRKSPFRIPFTQEVFESESEYKEQLQLYQQPLWTCQSTGESGLTYEEAHLSEVKCKRLVREKISTPLRRAVLQFVHHSIGTLETVLDNTEERLNSRFQIGETVELLKCKGKLIKGKILKEWTEQAYSGSPSSDKENHGLEPELISNNNARHFSCFYNIQISGRESKVISSVPASDLIRCNDLPSRDDIQLLVRSHALQAGTKPTSPWVVTPDVIKELKLRNKLIEAMLPSTRISIRGLKGEVKLKRIRCGNSPPPPIKKIRLDNGCSKPDIIVNGNHTPPSKHSDAIVIDTDNEEYRDVSLTPSPEKIFLDHSYSSPQSKTKKLSQSPKPKSQTPQSISPVPSIKKKSTFMLLESLKNTNKEEKVKKKPKKNSADLVKESISKNASKKKSKKDRTKSKIDVVNISSDSDSDVVLLDLSRRLSPRKSPPVRRTLTDHFFSLSKDRATGREKLVSSFSSPEKTSESSPSKFSNRIVNGRSRTSEAAIFPHGDVTNSDSKNKTMKIDQSKKKTKVKKIIKSVDVKKVNRTMIKTPIKSPSSVQQLLSSCSKITTKRNFDTPKKPPIKKGSTGTPQKSGMSPQKMATKIIPQKENMHLIKEIRKSPAKTNKSPAKTNKSPAKSNDNPGKTSKSSAKTNKSPAKSLDKIKNLTKAKKSVKAKGRTKNKSLAQIKSLAKAKTILKSNKVLLKKSSHKKKLIKGTTSPANSQLKVLKQVTLFNFATTVKKIPEFNSSDDDALIMYKGNKKLPPSPPREPLIAAKLMREKRINNKIRYRRLICQAAKTLTIKQIQMLKSPIKCDVVAKAVAVAAKLKWTNMTPEEKKKVLDTKRSERKKVKYEERKKKMEEEKEKAKRYDDQSLTGLKPLVAPKPVVMPEGLPNTMFGDIAMVVEFLNCYNGLLMPNDPSPVTADSFMKALVCGKEGFAYLSRMLVIFLKTLLQDQITEEFTQIGVKLSDIPVNIHTASELLRLSLLQSDEGDSDHAKDDDSDNSSVNQEGEFTAPQELVEQLQTVEFFSLQPEEKLELMACFCSRILSTYSLVDFLDEKQKKSSQLWNEKMKSLILKNIQKKEDMKKQKEEKEAAQKEKEMGKLAAENKEKAGEPANAEMVNGEAANDKVTTEKAANETVANEKIGNKKDASIKPSDNKTTANKEEAKKVEPKKVEPKKVEPKKVEPKKVEPPTPEKEPDDLASVVKRRRILAARAKHDQEEQDKKDKERRLQEQEENKILKQKQTLERNYEESLQHVKTLLRQLPIGTDRNHSRYWVFSTVTPGLFIEKGWVNQDIDYCTVPSKKVQPKIDTETEQNSTSDADGVKIEVETSIPKVGQNLWFQYDTIEEMDNLLESLNNQGIRESVLYMELKKRYPDITKHIYQSKKGMLPLRDSDGPKELLESFREDLKDIEVHVSQGHLGGVANFEKWEKRLDTATKIKDLGPLLIESQAAVYPKFLEDGMMAAPKRVVKTEEEDEEEDNTKTDKLSEKLLQWIAAVKNAQTLSRLHVLLSIFEVCIKWEKSSNARCRICRKKVDVNSILLCDECNQPFHLFCVRPALSSAPKGEWKCPACTPASERVCRKRNYKELTDSEEESEEEEEEEYEEEDSSHSNDSDEDYEGVSEVETDCCVCGISGETVSCGKCKSVYHKDCHEPPMRNFPRGSWTCYSCLHGKSRRRKATGKQRKCTKRNIGRLRPR